MAFGLVPCTLQIRNSFIGEEEGWSLLYNGQLVHSKTYKPFRQNSSSFDRITYGVGDCVSSRYFEIDFKIGAEVCFQNNEIRYFKNGKYVGVGFSTLPLHEHPEYYFAVSLSNTQVKLVKFHSDSQPKRKAG